MQFVCAVSEIRWTGQTRKKIAVDCSVAGLRQSSHFLPLTSLPNIWSYKIWRCERVFRRQDKRNKDLRSEEWGLIVWSLAGVRQSRHFLLLTSSAACGCLATCLSSAHFISIQCRRAFVCWHNGSMFHALYSYIYTFHISVYVGWGNSKI